MTLLNDYALVMEKRGEEMLCKVLGSVGHLAGLNDNVFKHESPDRERID